MMIIYIYIYIEIDRNTYIYMCSFVSKVFGIAKQVDCSIVKNMRFAACEKRVSLYQYIFVELSKSITKFLFGRLSSWWKDVYTETIAAVNNYGKHRIPMSVDFNVELYRSALV